MIQRRQNAYLLILAVIAIVISFMSKAYAQLDLENSFLNMSFSSNFIGSAGETGKTEPISSAKVQYVLWCIALFAMISIVSFKNLKRQITFCSFNFAFILFLPVFAYLDYSELATIYKPETFKLLGPAIVPIALLLLNILAVSGVVRDHKLLKSMDRIR